MKTAGGTTGSTYWYGADGRLTDEQSVGLNPGNGYPGQLERNFYLDGELMYRLGTSSNPDRMLVHDQLGSTRVEVDKTGGTTYVDYFPFGGYVVNPNDTVDQKFTGQLRDTETGNDYFGARFYSSNLGRFMSPDSLGNFVADVSNPQTWNMYAYALNNPLKFTDPTGYDCAYLNDSGNGIESLDQNSNSDECTKNGGYWADGAITNFEVNDNGSYRFTSLDSNLNTLYTNFSDGGNTGSTASLDVMSYFFNYQIQQRQLQQSPSLWSMSPEQRIKQIALAQPTLCGGGAFAYGGRSVDAGPVSGFAGGIAEADTRSGGSVGRLFEASGGEGVVGGGGRIYSGGSSEPLAFGGIGIYAPSAHASIGEVGYPSGVGVYADGSAGGWEGGAGAYLNVTTNAACMAAHK